MDSPHDSTRARDGSYVGSAQNTDRRHAQMYRVHNNCWWFEGTRWQVLKPSKTQIRVARRSNRRRITIPKLYKDSSVNRAGNDKATFTSRRAVVYVENMSNNNTVGRLFSVRVGSSYYNRTRTLTVTPTEIYPPERHTRTSLPSWNLRQERALPQTRESIDDKSNDFSNGQCVTGR